MKTYLTNKTSKPNNDRCQIFNYVCVKLKFICLPRQYPIVMEKWAFFSFTSVRRADAFLLSFPKNSFLAWAGSISEGFNDVLVKANLQTLIQCPSLLPAKLPKTFRYCNLVCLSYHQDVP